MYVGIYPHTCHYSQQKSYIEKATNSSPRYMLFHIAFTVVILRRPQDSPNVKAL